MTPQTLQTPQQNPEAKMPARPALDVTHPLRFHEWLVGNVGTKTLPGFYVRDGELVRVPRIGEDGYRPLTDNIHDEDGPAQVRPCDTATLRAVLARQFRPVKIRETDDGDFEETEVLPPHDAANLFVAGVAEQGTAAPKLKGVVHSPFIRPDGSVRTAAGYDAATGLLHLPPPGLTVPPPPERPTEQQVADARDLLLEIIAEFPFVSDDDRASYFGSVLIGPLLRPLVKPPYPITALSAHMPGSGKSLLANIGMELHGGVFRSEPSGRDEEIRKLITSLLRCTSAPLIVLDNLTGTFRSGQFAAMATSATWSDRPLGSTAQVEAPNDRLWILTGNNIVLGGDMPRRVAVWSRIDADMPDPHLRDQFAIPDLLEHVRGNRGDTLGACLTIVRAWVAAGSPLVGPKRADSYGQFIRTVQGILETAGVPGEYASPKVAAEASPVGSEDDEAAEFLAALARRWPAGFRSRDIVDDAHRATEVLRERAKGYQRPASSDAEAVLHALPEDLAVRVGGPGFSRSVGKWLSYRVGQWKGGHVLRKGADGHDKVAVFRVETRG